VPHAWQLLIAAAGSLEIHDRRHVLLTRVAVPRDLQAMIDRGAGQVLQVQNVLVHAQVLHCVHALAALGRDPDHGAHDAEPERMALQGLLQFGRHLLELVGPGEGCQALLDLPLNPVDFGADLLEQGAG
jgi:hypothetical protein